MIVYALRRVGWTLVVLWATATITFGATFLSPIDPARSYAGLRATPETIRSVRHQFGLDRPLGIQYLRYLDRLAHGNLGLSYNTDQPVLHGILARFPDTALLALAAGMVQLTIGVPLGLIAALSRRNLIDKAILLFSLVGVVTPAFVLGFILLYFLAFKGNLFPLGGNASLRTLILPAVTLGIPGSAWYARMLRSTVLNILGEDYVRMARSKGLPERLVVARHVLRNALSPIITMVGLDIGAFFGGVLVIERVFDWPGIGQQAWTAITFNDIPMIMGTVLFAAFFITLFNLGADLVNALIDPRVKYA
jgi:peptide/nickel transport system permease protein